VRVPERHVAQLAPGQAVRLDADALPAPIDARIERLAPVVDAATGTVKVTVAVENAVSLRPGAFVEVDIVTEVHEDALVIPRSALVAEGRRWLVYRASASGDTVAAVEVVLGYEEGDRVEVTGTVGERELDVGDEVVVLGASALSDGAPILILERRAATEKVASASGLE
jgi:membrane fusion protein (multidrug efflux system)